MLRYNNQYSLSAAKGPPLFNAIARAHSEPVRCKHHCTFGHAPGVVHALAAHQWAIYMHQSRLLSGGKHCSASGPRGQGCLASTTRCTHSCGAVLRRSGSDSVLTRRAACERD
jgi:hypothetical protein